jgi:hypothetical protein
MGRQIIKQPNGKYAVFSSIVDALIAFDMTKEELIQMRIDEETENIKRDIGDILDKIERKENPYYQFAKTPEEMIEWIGEIHSVNSEEYKDALKFLGNKNELHKKETDS